MTTGAFFLIYNFLSLFVNWGEDLQDEFFNLRPPIYPRDKTERKERHLSYQVEHVRPVSYRLSMSQTSNEAQTQCFIETPIVILIGEQNTPLVFNVLANILLTFTAVLGNVSILFSFVFVPSLRSISNYLIFGLALTDLGVGLIVHPLYIHVLLCVYNNRVPPCSVLAAYSIATSFLSGISLLYITIIGLDRYLAIKLHLRYRILVTEKRVGVTQIALWLINFLLNLVWLKGFRVYSTFAAVVVSMSLVVTFFVYAKVYQVVKRHRVHIQDQMESQMSQFENFRSKRLRRSAINTLYVFFIFLLCYLPFCVITVLNNISNSLSKTNVLAFEFSATLMLSNSSLNPIMYCIRLSGFRTAIKKTYRRMLCLKISYAWFEVSFLTVSNFFPHVK